MVLVGISVALLPTEKENRHPLMQSTVGHQLISEAEATTTRACHDAHWWS